MGEKKEIYQYVRFFQGALRLIFLLKQQIKFLSVERTLTQGQSLHSKGQVHGRNVILSQGKDKDLNQGKCKRIRNQKHHTEGNAMPARCNAKCSAT